MSRGAALDRAFFARDATVVAPELVGKLLLRTDDGLVARVVEVEAYRWDDPACHAYRGRTTRNAPLFGPPGHAYVYFVYGMHWCLNVATGPEGSGEGCLLRAAEPLEGLARMRARRFGDPNGAVARRSDKELLRGPARLAQAFGLDGAWSGVAVSGSGRDLPGGQPADHPGLVCFADDGDRPAVTATPRTGVAAAEELPWRFVADDSPWASPYRPHRRAVRG